MQANRTDRLILKDGTILEGSIRKQVFGKSIEFYTESIEMKIDSQWIKKEYVDDYNIYSLPDPWKNWFQKKIGQTNSNAIVNLSRIQFVNDDDTQDNINENEYLDSLRKSIINKFDKDNCQVFIKEKGRYIKFVYLRSHVYTFYLDDMRSIQFHERSSKHINGIVDVIETSDGHKYEGQIVENIVGDSIKIKTNNGIIQFVNVNNISDIRKYPLNPQMDIYKQIPYLEKVKNITGVITHQHFGKHRSEDMIYVTDVSNKRHSMQTSEIKKIERIKNVNYKPLFDEVIGENEVYLNKKKVLASTLPKEILGIYVLKSNILEYISEVNPDTGEKELLIELENIHENQPVMLFPISARKIGKMFFFSIDISNKMVYNDKLVTAKNNLRLTYKIGKGTYAFCKNDCYYFFKIK